MSVCPVDQCTTTPSPGWRVCERHVSLLFAALFRVPALETELGVTIARQDRLQAEHVGGRSAERPLPFNWSGSEQGWTLSNTLATWAGELARALDLPLDEYGHPAELAWERVPAAPRHALAHVVAVPARTVEEKFEELDEKTGETITRTVVTIIPPRFHDDPAAIVPPPGLAARAATWLARRVDDLVRLDSIGAALDEIVHVVERTRYVIDRAPSRWYAGACDVCATAMYARPGVAEVLCPNAACTVEVEPARCATHEQVGEWCSRVHCHVTPAVVERTRYDVEARRSWMLAAAQEYMATAAEAVGLVRVLTGLELNVNTLRTAAHRGDPPPIRADYSHPENDRAAKPRARYRLGDVIEFAQRKALRRAG
jgi:hypothetical protein